MRLRTLLVGIETQNLEIENVQNALQAPSLFDYDIVIADVDSVIPAEWRTKISVDEHLTVEEDVGKWFRKALEKLRKEAALLIEKGGMLVCLLRPVRGLKWTWYNYSERRSEHEFDSNYDWIPIEQLDWQIASGFGKVIKLCDEPGPFARYIKTVETFWTAYVDDIGRLNVQSRSIALNDAGKPVAFEIPLGKGSVVFLPLCKHENMSDVLVECASASLKKTSERRPPPWIEQIKVPNENSAQKSLSALAEKIAEQQAQYDLQFKALEDKTQVKKLLYEKDEPLEEAVMKAFEELGFSLTKKGDKDWIASSDAGEAILEVTGCDGSIDIDKFRQLLNYLIEENKAAGAEKKAILVGNHFANDPPQARKEPFTEKVLKQAEVFSMCLMPTLELFYLIVKLREGKVKANDIQAKIFETVGLFKCT